MRFGTALCWFCPGILVIVPCGRGTCWTSTDVDVESALAAARYQSFCSQCCKWCVIFIAQEEYICCFAQNEKGNGHYLSQNSSFLVLHPSTNTL